MSIRISLLMLICLIDMAGIHSAQADDNLKFSGFLVMDPCELDPDTSDVEVSFGTIVDKYLYLNQRTHSQQFVINLKDCDIDSGNIVQMTFSGTPSTELPGYIVPSSGEKTGIAVGMERVVNDGSGPIVQLLPFNEAMPTSPLFNGTTTLRFRAFIQRIPSAIASHSIVRGNFSAVATFTIEYP